MVLQCGSVLTCGVSSIYGEFFKNLGENGGIFILTLVMLNRNVDPPIWYDTAVKLFEIQRI